MARSLSVDLAGVSLERLRADCRVERRFYTDGPAVYTDYPALEEKAAAE